MRLDIPREATERLIQEYRQEGPLIYHRLTECVLNGQVVGQRAYTEAGQLVRETPMKNGQKHGREYTWDESGALVLVEPYVKDKIHGTAKQYGQNGQVIGTYTLTHGTGFDIWRQEDQGQSVYVSEIHSLQAGLPHGYEWWLDANQRTVHHELHWDEGLWHGIERRWNSAGKLSRRYPKYWVKGGAVTKRQYLTAAQTDKTLPPFRENDNSPRRRFPPEILRRLSL